MSPLISEEQDRLSQRKRVGDRVVASGPDPGSTARWGIGGSASAGRPDPSPLRHGWAITIITVINVCVAVLAIAADRLMVGLVVCSALSLVTIVLVVAEVLHRRRVALGLPPKPRRRREPFLRPW